MDRYGIKMDPELLLYLKWFPNHQVIPFQTNSYEINCDSGYWPGRVLTGWNAFGFSKLSGYIKNDNFSILGSLLLSIKWTVFSFCRRGRIDGRQGGLRRPLIGLAAKDELKEFCLRYIRCDSMIKQSMSPMFWGGCRAWGWQPHLLAHSFTLGYLKIWSRVVSPLLEVCRV